MELTPRLPTQSPADLVPRHHQPVYLMLKPLASIADAIWRQARALGIESNYAKERYHITLLPLGDVAHIPSALMALLVHALAAFEAEPFEIALKRVSGNALQASSPMCALHALQDQLVAHLIAAGFPVLDYEFSPHLSLTYGEWEPRNLTIPSIFWRAEELLLVKSIHRERRHEILQRIPLISRQPTLPW